MLRNHIGRFSGSLTVAVCLGPNIQETQLMEARLLQFCYSLTIFNSIQFGVLFLYFPPSSSSMEHLVFESSISSLCIFDLVICYLDNIKYIDPFCSSAVICIYIYFVKFSNSLINSQNLSLFTVLEADGHSVRFNVSKASQMSHCQTSVSCHRRCLFKK